MQVVSTPFSFTDNKEIPISHGTCMHNGVATV